MRTAHSFLAKTFAGLESVLGKELQALGATDIQEGKRVVQFKGDKSLMYRVNLRVRTALRILQPIAAFNASNEHQLYRNVRQIDWSRYIEARDTLAIDAVANSRIFRHSKFVALKTKDAIVDQFREKKGIRPSVDVKNPTLRVHAHIRGDRVEISLDSSGDSLHKRGYRLTRTEAPLNEVLAAGLILLSGWEADSHFIDPMCGSGTLVIEAASLARNQAPQINRKHFGFMRWKDFDREMWEKEVEDAKKAEREFAYRILGSDKSPVSLEVAKQNLARSGVGALVALRTKAFQSLPPPPPGRGMLVTNPPYGERLKPHALFDLYKMIGDTLKQKYSGYDAWVFSSNREAMKQVGLRASKKLILFNGPLECRFHQYKMYSGTENQGK